MPKIILNSVLSHVLLTVLILLTPVQLTIRQLSASSAAGEVLTVDPDISSNSEFHHRGARAVSLAPWISGSRSKEGSDDVALSEVEVLSTERVREALRALLALNDGELKGLLGGAPPHVIAPKLSPSTILFLAATQRQLHQLKKSLPYAQKTFPGDMLIAKRRRISTAKRSQDPDSLLTAIAQLSAYVHDSSQDADEIRRLGAEEDERINIADLDTIVKSRRRRSHKDHIKVQHHKHDSCKFHPDFWFRPRGKTRPMIHLKTKTFY